MVGQIIDKFGRYHNDFHKPVYEHRLLALIYTNALVWLRSGPLNSALHKFNFLSLVLRKFETSLYPAPKDATKQLGIW